MFYVILLLFNCLHAIGKSSHIEKLYQSCRPEKNFLVSKGYIENPDLFTKFVEAIKRLSNDFIG